MRKWALYILYLFAFGGWTLPVSGQNTGNLYDLEHSKKYGEYLYLSHQYDLAAEEFERSLFLQPEDGGLRLRLLQSYRKAGNYERGIHRLRVMYPLYDSLPKGLGLELGKCLILDQQYARLHSVLTDSLDLPAGEEAHFALLSNLLQKKYQASVPLFAEMKSQLDPADKRVLLYAPIVEDASQVRYRKPWLGMLMSTVVPGTGKFYAGQFGDGLTALMIIGLTGFQAYRVLKNDGLESILGWGLAGVSFTFYCANIYGSHRAVRRYNEKIDRGIRKRTRAVMERTF